MSLDEKTNEKRVEKLKNWLKNKNNFAVILVFAFAVIVRFYYFILTENQPLWWDESEYMSIAKNYAGIVDYPISGIRLPGFPLLMSIFFRLGITSEPVIRFIGLLIPSLIVVFLAYFMVKQMYPDKKVALISAAIMSVLWENLFYSNRFQTENWALIFEFLAIFVLFKGYMKKEKIWFIKPGFSLVLVVLFSIISVLFRPGNMIFLPAIAVFFVVANLSWFLDGKRKNISLILLAALVVLAFFAAPSILKTPLFAANYHPENSIAWNTLGVFWGFYQSPAAWIPSLLFYAFIFGLLVFLMDLGIYSRKIKSLQSNAEDIEFKSDIFNFLILLSVLGAFMFMIRPTAYEFRWLFPLLPGMLALTSKGVITASQYAGMFLKSRILTVVLIVLIVVLGAYTQLIVSDSVIKGKLTSYQQVKDSGLWLKQNSYAEDILISASAPQHTYYSERKVYGFKLNGLAPDAKENKTSFEIGINKIKPRYLVVSAFEPSFTPQWAYTWANDTNAVPVQAYFADEQKKQAVLIIYELKYPESNAPSKIIELENLSRMQ